MSASQEKKIRNSLRSEGNDKKLNAAVEEQNKNKKFRIKATIAAVIVVIVIAAAIVINSNLFYTKTTAVKIGDTSYSAAEYNCYYQMAYNTIYNQMYSMYGDYMSYILDTSTPLSEQQYSEDQTWADYVEETAVDNMKQVTALYDDAVKNGYQLTAEDTETIESSVSSMLAYATSYGYENLDAFLATNYGGKGMTEKLYREILTKTTMAYSYAQSVSDSYTYTDEELKAFYEEHKDEYDMFTFETYYVGTTDSAFAEMEADAQVTAAHDAAAEIAKATNEEAFLAAVQNYAGETGTATPSSLQGNNLSSYYSDWLKDSSRKVGDTTVVDIDGGSYAVLYLGRDDNNYNTVSMRHILVNVEANEDGQLTTEAMQAAKAKAEEILAEWQADPTEENFATLANEYSEDSGSNTNGGLYEDIYRNYMVDSIDEFLFDSGAQPGDTTVVLGTNGSYTGYHVVYFAGIGQLYADYLAETQMRSDDYTEYVTALTEPYTVSYGSGMKFVDVE